MNNHWRENFSDNSTISEIRKIPESTTTRQKHSVTSRQLQKLEALLIQQSLQKIFCDKLTITELRIITESPSTKQKSSVMSQLLQK